MMDCPVSTAFSGFEITWRKEGRPLPVRHFFLSSSHQLKRLDMRSSLTRSFVERLVHNPQTIDIDIFH